jgi:hypothetical protein
MHRARPGDAARLHPRDFAQLLTTEHTDTPGSAETRIQGWCRRTIHETIG